MFVYFIFCYILAWLNFPKTISNLLCTKAGQEQITNENSAIFLGLRADLDFKFLLKIGSGSEPDLNIFRKKSFVK